MTKLARLPAKIAHHILLLSGLLVFLCVAGCADTSADSSGKPTPTTVAKNTSETSGTSSLTEDPPDPTEPKPDPQENSGANSADGQSDDSANNASTNDDSTDGAATDDSTNNVGDNSSTDSSTDASTDDGAASNDSSSGDSNSGDTSSTDSNTDGSNANAANDTANNATNNAARNGGQSGNGDAPPETVATVDPEQRKKELEAKRGRDGVYELTFDDIKFDMETGSKFERDYIGEAIESLGNKRIRIRGYIYPTTQQHPEQFILVRDNMECCFGPGAALYDCVAVIMNPGKQTTFTTRPVTVEGTFSVEVREFDGTVFSIYRMDADSAK